MNANPDQRPTASELYNILHFWHNSTYGNCQDIKKFGYKGKEIKAIFEEADKEIPMIYQNPLIHLSLLHIFKILCWQKWRFQIKKDYLLAFVYLFNY
ncbi:unnamed protein product [Rhizophagus irregularis]|nr:unnamed protein product [Rhizophagus irregularis]